MQIANCNSKLSSFLALGIRIFDDNVRSTDATESAALWHKIDMVDIYSNSWGPGDMGWQVKGPGVLASRAIELGVEQVHDKMYQKYIAFEIKWLTTFGGQQ